MPSLYRSPAGQEFDRMTDAIASAYDAIQAGDATRAHDALVYARDAMNDTLAALARVVESNVPDGTPRGFEACAL